MKGVKKNHDKITLLEYLSDILNIKNINSTHPTTAPHDLSITKNSL
jgi:hypothetical protein